MAERKRKANVSGPSKLSTKTCEDANGGPKAVNADHPSSNNVVADEIKQQLENVKDGKLKAKAKPNTYQKTDFEDLFYNPVTQSTAWQLLRSIPIPPFPVVGSSNYLSDDGNGNTGGMKLRARPEKDNCSSRSAPPRKTSIDTDNYTTPLSPGSPDSSDTSTNLADGTEMVNELLARYETNKKMSRTKPLEPEHDQCGSDSSELEDLSDDDCKPMLKKSDFMKYTIPQYEQKSELYQMHSAVIRSLTSVKMNELCESILPELQQITDEAIYSKRHETFKTGDISSRQTLREMIVAKPFTMTHDNCVINLINRMLDEDPHMEVNGEVLHYISLVLVPEALIRIFAKVNNLNYDFAEKELRFGAGYDGELPQELLQCLQQG